MNNHKEKISDSQEIASNGFDSVRIENSQKENNVYVHSLILFKGEYKIVISETRINDSIYFDYSNVFNQVPISNLIRFYNMDKLIAESHIPFKSVTAKNYSHLLINYLDNKISEINLVKTANKFLLMISGYGGCDSCNESTIYYTLSGEVAYFWYGRKSHVEKEMIDDKITSKNEMEKYKIFERVTF